jgi:two-component sensor histidine kinase
VRFSPLQFGRKAGFVSFNAEGVFLDIQTATSLGLIINELVCNHQTCFPEESGGRIVISVEKRSV